MRRAATKRKTQRKTKKKAAPSFKTWLISKLRSACQKWPPYYETKKACKVEVEILGAEKHGSGFLVTCVSSHGKEIVFLANHSPKLGRRILYWCEGCMHYFLDKDYYTYKNGKRKKRTTIVVDHIEPVVSVEAREDEMTWDEYINRMFPQGDGKYFQVLCRSCHDSKTKEENEQRRKNKTH